MNDPANRPVFSVVVPTHNRARELAGMLEALSAQSYPRNRFEVVLVDDGSDSPLAPVVGPFRDRLRITLLCQPQAGPANARQRGVDRARGAYLAFTDDDCRPAPDWLARLEPCCLSHPGAAVGGRMINGLRENPYSEASQLVVTYLTDYFNADPNNATYFPTSNLVFPARPFRAAVGLDRRWSISGGEDRDLCRRWLAAGYRLIYCPEAVVYHYHRLDLRSFWRQHFSYGRGGFRHRYVAAAGSWRGLKFERPTFYLRLVQAAFLRLGPGMACRVAPLVVLSQIANTAGFAREATMTLVSRWRAEQALGPGPHPVSCPAGGPTQAPDGTLVE